MNNNALMLFLPFLLGKKPDDSSVKTLFENMLGQKKSDPMTALLLGMMFSGQKATEQKRPEKPEGVEAVTDMGKDITNLLKLLIDEKSATSL